MESMQDTNTTDPTPSSNVSNPTATTNNTSTDQASTDEQPTTNTASSIVPSSSATLPNSNMPPLNPMMMPPMMGGIMPAFPPYPMFAAPGMLPFIGMPPTNTSNTSKTKV